MRSKPQTTPERRNLTLYSRSANRLDLLRDLTEAQSDSEVVRQALKYYEQFLDDLRGGRKLCVIDAAGAVREVLVESLKDDPADGNLVRRNLMLHKRSSSRLDMLRAFANAASDSEVVRQALKLYEILVNESARGNGLCVVTGDQIDPVRLGSLKVLAGSSVRPSKAHARLDAGPGFEQLRFA